MFLTSDVAYVVAAGIAQMLFSLAVLGAVMTMRGRVTPWPLLGVWLLVFFVIAGVVMNRAIAGDFDVASDLFARSPWLAAFGLAMLIVLFDMSERRSPGRAWLAGAIAFYLCLEIWAPFVYADSALFAQLFLVNAVVAIFAGLGSCLWPRKKSAKTCAMNGTGSKKASARTVASSCMSPRPNGPRALVTWRPESPTTSTTC